MVFRDLTSNFNRNGSGNLEEKRDNNKQLTKIIFRNEEILRQLRLAKLNRDIDFSSYSGDEQEFTKLVDQVNQDDQDDDIESLEDVKRLTVEDFDADPDIEEMHLASEKDIEDGKVYTTEEMIEMVRSNSLIETEDEKKWAANYSRQKTIF
jgi:hypothetical protein